ncbi:MAG: MFS transporter [Myxococcales bacterium]|nr:MFS transporter [Myxococcales bacterium]
MPAAEPLRTSHLRAYGALAVLALINLINYLDRYVVAGFLPLVQSEFHRTDTEMGVLTSSFLIVYSIAAPFTGVWGDYLPRKWFIGGGVLLWSLATVWSGQARSFEELLLARAAIGIGEAGYAAVAPGFISDLFEVRRRGRMLSLFYAALPVGVAAGYAVGGSVGATYGWRSAFYVAAFPGFALGLIAFFLREPRRGEADLGLPAKPRPSLLEIVSTLASTRSYLVNTAGMAAMTFAMGGLGAFMPTFLFRERGVPLERAGPTFGLCLVIAGFAGTLVGGWLGDWLQAKDRGGYFLSSGLGLALGVPGALLAAVSAEPAVYWAAIFAALFFLFFNTGPLNAALMNVVPAGMRASANAVNVLLVHMLGDAVSPIVIGAISDASSLGIAIIVNSGVIALSAAILLIGRGVLRRDLEALARGEAPAGRGRGQLSLGR